MKNLLPLVPLFLLTGCFNEPTVALRIDCGSYNNDNLMVSINGEVKGECPLDIMVNDGETLIEARRDNKDASYQVGSDKVFLAANVMKKVKLNISSNYPEVYYFKKATDIKGMERYLNKYPEGKYFAKVLSSHEEAIYKRTTTIEGMKAYLQAYPVGKYAKTTYEKLEKKEWDKVLKNIGSKFNSNYDSDNDKQTLKHYISQYSDSKFISKAHERLEKVYAEHALANNYLDNAIEYIELYQNGKYYPEVVKLFKSKLKEKIKGNKKRSATIKYVQKYIDLFPEDTDSQLYKSRYKYSLNPESRYSILSDGKIIQDKVTNLQWMACVLSLKSEKLCSNAEKMNRGEATKVISSLNYGGYSDWRLPTTKELESLVYCNTQFQDYYYFEAATSESCYGKRYPPMILQQVFGQTPKGLFMTSQDYFSQGVKVVDFRDGNDGWVRHGYKTYVRLVRKAE